MPMNSEVMSDPVISNVCCLGQDKMSHLISDTHLRDHENRAGLECIGMTNLPKTLKWLV
jgi:hypothetical protein